VEEALAKIKVNPNRRHLKVKNRIHNKAFSKSTSKGPKHWGQNNPARWMLGKVKASWGTSSSEHYRKELFVSWLIIYRMLEIHTGFPFPLMMPPEVNLYRQYQYAIADILDLCTRIPNFAKHNHDLMKNTLFISLMGTPGIIDPYLFPRKNPRTNHTVPSREATMQNCSFRADRRSSPATKGKYGNKYWYKTWGMENVKRGAFNTIEDMRKNKEILKDRGDKIIEFFKLADLYESSDEEEFDVFREGRQDWNIHKKAGASFDKSISNIYRNLELHMQGRVSTVDMFNLILESLASIRKMLRRLDKNIDKDKAFKGNDIKKRPRKKKVVNVRRK
jgi:hypothetical protein